MHPDSIWSLAWTAENQLISACADGHLRIYDSTQLTAPLHDLPAHPLAISSLSSNVAGSRSLSISLDGTAVLVQPKQGVVMAKVDTGREKAASGESGESKTSRFAQTELPAYTGALHPQDRCWAWSGRSSKIAIRHMQQDTGDDSQDQGLLSGEGTVIEAGKGKFGMDLQFVSALTRSSLTPVPRRKIVGTSDGDWSCRRSGYRNASHHRDVYISCHGREDCVLEPGLTSKPQSCLS